MFFTVRHGTTILATFDDPNWWRAFDCAREHHGAIVWRTLDDGMEHPMQVKPTPMGAAAARRLAADDTNLSHEARNNIARGRARGRTRTM